MTASIGDLLGPFRRRIDEIDSAIVDLLSQRMQTVQQVIAVKGPNHIPALLEDRVEAVVAHVRTEAEAKGCPPDFTEHVWRAMMDWVIAYEERHLASSPKPSEPGKPI